MFRFLKLTGRRSAGTWGRPRKPSGKRASSKGIRRLFRAVIREK